MLAGEWRVIGHGEGVVAGSTRARLPVSSVEARDAARALACADGAEAQHVAAQAGGDRHDRLEDRRPCAPGPSCDEGLVQTGRMPSAIIVSIVPTGEIPPPSAVLPGW